MCKNDWKFVYTAKIGDNTKFVYPSKTEQKANFVYSYTQFQTKWVKKDEY